MEVDAEGGRRVIESLQDVAPDLGRYVIEFAFGEIYQRPALDLRQRQLITISALTTLGGAEPQLEVHVKAGLNVGLSAREVVEAILHCIPYTGFPRVLNATFVAKPRLRGTWPQPDDRVETRLTGAAACRFGDPRGSAGAWANGEPDASPTTKRRGCMHRLRPREAPPARRLRMTLAAPSHGCPASTVRRGAWP